jgi:hypothetical protein
MRKLLFTLLLLGCSNSRKFAPGDCVEIKNTVDINVNENVKAQYTESQLKHLTFEVVDVGSKYYIIVNKVHGIYNSMNMHTINQTEAVFQLCKTGVL